MSGVSTYKDLKTLVTRFREDLNQQASVSQKKVVKIPPTILLVYAYNRTGKTRLSMEFKDAGKRQKQRSRRYPLLQRLHRRPVHLGERSRWRLRPSSPAQPRFDFFNGLKDLALDEAIAAYLDRYADFDFDIDYTEWKVSFRKDAAENIKISRGEQNIFIWCLFMAICERMLDGHVSYQANKFLYIDDPISSLDDNNAIAVACDLAKLLRRAASRTDSNGNPAPIKIVFSSHHALFFNVMCNEIGRSKEGEAKVAHKRYFLQSLYW